MTKRGTSNELSFSLHEGNYRVVVGGGAVDERAYIWAAPRRLLRHFGKSTTGESTFTVHVRRRALHLTIAGYKVPPMVDVSPAQESPTAFLVGDSTVCDQTETPWCCWGQMLPAFFDHRLAVGNYAKSGASSHSFIKDGRLGWLLKRLRSQDYLLVQFAHNDQKLGLEPFGAYQESLSTYVDAALKLGATPVLVSPVQRTTFTKSGAFENSLGDYPGAVRCLASKRSIPLIDLSARSERLFRELGPEGAKIITVNGYAGRWPRYPDGVASKSHHTEYGAFELAKLVANEIVANVPALGKYLRRGEPVDYENPMLPDTGGKTSS